MLVVRHPDQALHDPEQVFRLGTFIAQPDRRDEGVPPLGDRPAAARQMDAMLAASGGNLGLLHEQVDPATGAMLGNMPQALSHLALIHAANALNEGRD